MSVTRAQGPTERHKSTMSNGAVRWTEAEKTWFEEAGLATDTMKKAKIIVGLEDIVLTRLFGRGAWLADRETSIVTGRRFLQLGLIEWTNPPYWRFSRLGKEIDLELYYVFMGLFQAWKMPDILRSHHLIDESEADAIYERLCSAEPESVLSGYVKRAYFDYWKASKFLH
jgi:hypothetical protein